MWFQEAIGSLHWWEVGKLLWLTGSHSAPCFVQLVAGLGIHCEVLSSLDSRWRGWMLQMRTNYVHGLMDGLAADGSGRCGSP